MAVDGADQVVVRWSRSRGNRGCPQLSSYGAGKYVVHCFWRFSILTESTMGLRRPWALGVEMSEVVRRVQRAQAQHAKRVGLSREDTVYPGQEYPRVMPVRWPC